MIDTWLFSYK